MMSVTSALLLMAIGMFCGGAFHLWQTRERGRRRRDADDSFRQIWCDREEQRTRMENAQAYAETALQNVALTLDALSAARLHLGDTSQPDVSGGGRDDTNAMPQGSAPAPQENIEVRQELERAQSAAAFALHALQSTQAVLRTHRTADQ